MASKSVVFLTETGVPGQYRTTEGNVIDVGIIRDDFVIDTIGLSAQTIAANEQRDLFQTRTGVKDRQHGFKFAGANQLPPQTMMLRMLHIGAHVRQAIGDNLVNMDDAVKLYENGTLRFWLDNNDVAYEGPLLGLQSGYGIWGATGDTSSPIVTNGPPSPTSPPVLHPRAQWAITSKHVLSGYFKWPNGTWYNDASEAGASQYANPVIANRHALSLLVRGPIATS